MPLFNYWQANYPYFCHKVKSLKNYISNLRNIATFAVILLHVTAPFVLKFNKISFASWQLANLLDSMLRFGVPVFVMISGAVLLDRSEPLNIFLGKRLKRIFLPFLFWSIVYFIFIYAGNFQKFSISQLAQILTDKLLKGTYYHLWYIYMILGIYLFVPIVRKWVQNSTKQELHYFLLLWAITLFINTDVAKYIPSIEVLYFSKYLGYLVLGYYLDHYVVTKRSRNNVYFILFILGVALTFLSTSYLTVTANQLNITYYNYLSPNVCLIAIGIFLLGKSLLHQTNTTFTSLDRHSYGIYLAHVLVLHYVYRIVAPLKVSTKSPLSLLLYIIAVASVTYLVSYLLIKLLSLNKRLQKLVT
ncbi:acyltransferase [Pedobacter helvus]|uniref:Acyltransferase n=1 Tax=Pedobacter helvus TaxID=2563444 RepID=A0ABW9JJV2_9SPHI|nr:acyltransferase family protein [Pedobacter ureilyticus]